jgi:adenine phosphoribosyltransferase
MDIKKYIPVVPDWPRPGVDFLDISGLLITPMAFNHVVNGMSQWVKHCHATSVLAVESRGFIFAAPIAKSLGLPMIMVRKPNKLPGQTHTVSYETEYSTDSLCIKTDAPVGARPCVIDDVIATGGTVLAVAQLAQQYWPVDRILAAAVIGLDFLPGLKNLQAAGIETHTIVDYA